MRVLLVIDDLRRAGAQRVIAQEARALHPRFVTFHMAVLAHRPEPTFAADLTELGIVPSYVPGYGLLDPWRLRMLCGLIERVRPDLVHTHLTYANILGTLGSALAHRPCVASLHNVDNNQLKSPGVKRWLESFVLRRWASRIVIVSEAARTATARSFGLPIDRTVVVPNAVDPRSVNLPTDYDRARTRRQFGVMSEDRLVCGVGRLDASKGQRFLLDALKALQLRCGQPRLHLVLIGSGPDENDLRDRIARLGLADVVTLLGARESVAEIIAASDVFVQPSLNEGLSQATLEAMSIGTPVVATDVGGTSDVLKPGQTGWSVPPGEPIALAQAIHQALSNPRMASTYTDAAQRLVTQTCSFADHLERLQAVYASVGA
jgi:glycosyltransferase involved in cell wall biosynthesis